MTKLDEVVKRGDFRSKGPVEKPRAAQIGANHAALAREYGVSIQWIYKIVKTMHRDQKTARQPDRLTG